MGQRLNIQVISKGVSIANCYYHWSGYTSTGIELAQKAMNKLKEIKDGKEKLTDAQIAYSILSATGAELMGEEMQYVLDNNILHKEDIVDRVVTRNEGLIAFSKKNMEETIKWEEARITIDIFHNAVAMDIFGYDSWECFGSSHDDYEDMPGYEDMPILDFKFLSVGFEEFESNASKILNHIANEEYWFKSPDYGEIISFIE